MAAKIRNGVHFSTGDAARYVGVAQTTIAAMFDRGDLPGSRDPGSPIRRFEVEAFRAWLVANDIPTDEIDADFPRA